VPAVGAVAALVAAGAHGAHLAGAHRSGAAFDPVNEDTLRIALIAVVAVIAAKFVIPRIPGIGPKVPI
jgi:hypothetical protein